MALLKDVEARPGLSKTETYEDRAKELFKKQPANMRPPLIEVWAPRMSVAAHGFFVRHMKTRWGSCNQAAGTIRLNTELAKKPKECLEYIVVHELAHLCDATHGLRFVALMDRVMPSWRATRDLLNRLPGSHEDWGC